MILFLKRSFQITIEMRMPLVCLLFQLYFNQIQKSFAYINKEKVTLYFSISIETKTTTKSSLTRCVFSMIEK